MPTNTFRPQDVTVAFNGVPISGFADGTFVAWARNSQAYNIRVGSQGEGGRAGSGDKSGTITLTLLATSPVNGVLSALAAEDENTGNGIGLLAVKDLSGATVILAESAWVQKRPDGELSNEVTAREWVFETDVLEIFDGGNPI
jgi:hypothetical protein